MTNGLVITMHLLCAAYHHCFLCNLFLFLQGWVLALLFWLLDWVVSSYYHLYEQLFAPFSLEFGIEQLAMFRSILNYCKKHKSLLI